MPGTLPRPIEPVPGIGAAPPDNRRTSRRALGSVLLFVGIGGASSPGCLAVRPSVDDLGAVRAVQPLVENVAPRPEVFRGQSDEPPGSSSAGRGAFGLPPLSELLDDSPEEEESTYFPEARRDPVEPDIRKPGPDTANFPNSPFTLRQGRFYVEASPVVLSGPSVGTASTYNAEFLFRYGLTDRVELRLFSNGPVAADGRFAADGMSPLAWDLKVNFWDENERYHIPAVGLEVYLLTPTGSAGLNQGTQPSINLLFDHTLPFEVLLEWNVGIVGDPSPNNPGSVIEPIVQWAFQRELVEGFDVFFQGFFNGAALPRFGDGVVLGGGAVWALNTRIALFGSYNAGLTQEAPTTLFQFGGAVAF